MGKDKGGDSSRYSRERVDRRPHRDGRNDDRYNHDHKYDRRDKEYSNNHRDGHHRDRRDDRFHCHDKTDNQYGRDGKNDRYDRERSSRRNKDDDHDVNVNSGRNFRDNSGYKYPRKSSADRHRERKGSAEYRERTEKNNRLDRKFRETSYASRTQRDKREEKVVKSRDIH